MELLYTVNKRSGNTKIIPLDGTYTPRSLCRLSPSNICAFTTTCEIKNGTDAALGFHVYVADINMPWFPFKVMTNRFPISVIEWDILGKYLLIGDVAGHIQIWIQKEFLLSDWIQLYSVTLPGEHILKAKFFHNGRKTNIIAEKIDSAMYLDKFHRSKFSPSVVQFGGIPAEGCFIVTATGMIGSFLIPTELPSHPTTPGQNNQSANGAVPQLNGTSQANPIQNPAYLAGPYSLKIVTDCLGHNKSHITALDVSYGKNGQLLVAAVNANDKHSSSTTIQCYGIIIKRQEDSLSIKCQALPSFFLSEGVSQELKDPKVLQVRWTTTEDPDSLLVMIRSTNGNCIERWKLTEKTVQIHKLFQTTKSKMVKSVIWTPQNNYRHTGKIMDVVCSKFYFGQTAYVLVATDDNYIHCLNRESLKLESKASASMAYINRNDNAESLTKQLKLDSHLDSIDLTIMGNFAMTLDNYGQLYGYKITYPHQDKMGPYGMHSIVSLIEYCLYTGYDALDVFLTIKPQQLESIIERFSENFTRQPSQIQQYYYVNFLTIKTNLYRLSANGQQKAYDLSNHLMLFSILVAFKSLLRPSDLVSPDKGPAENLAMVLTESVPDVDKILVNLEAKDFTVEHSTLQSLQQLIQWVADLALNILAKLPENRMMAGMQRNSGYDISKDIVALNSIRELLVMIRIWGLLEPQCLPVFSRTSDIDVLSTLFRLLTRLSLNPNEPEESLLDDCCLLPSQLLIPQLQYISTQACILSPAYINLPIGVDYNNEPAALKYIPDIPTVDGGLASDNMLDSVRHLQLGKNPPKVRRCTRCGACSGIISIAKTAAMRAWEQRWASKCKCGGSWVIQFRNSH